MPCHDLLDAVCSTAAGKVQIGMGFFTVRARALSSRLSRQPGLQVLQPMLITDMHRMQGLMPL